MYQFNEEEYNARMTWYRDARFGMFLHWGLYSIPARGEWVRSVEQMTEEEYMPFFREFSASRFELSGTISASSSSTSKNRYSHELTSLLTVECG